MFLMVALSVALGTGIGRAALIQSEEKAAGDKLRVIEPEKTIALDPASIISRLYPSSDGRQFYTRLKTPAINIWSVLVYYTPEVLLSVLGLTLLVSVLLLLYSHRKGGLLHCRKCWYELINLTCDRCPECGVELSEKNRSYRRSVRMRMIQIGLMLVLGAGAYYLGSKNRWVFQQPRIQRKYYWNSTALYRSDFIRRWFPQWILEHRSQADRIVRIDFASGKIRNVRSLPHGKIEKWTIDSERKVISLIEFGRLTQIEAQTGRIIREYDFQDSQLNILSTDGVRRLIGGPSPEILFAASSKSGAYRIDLNQNLMEQIVDTKKFEVPDTPTGIFYDPEHQRLLITYKVKSSLAWQIWDESAGELHNNHAVADWDNSVGFVYNHTQEVIYTGNILTNSVEGHDVHSGQLTTRWPPMGEQIIPRSLLFDDQVLLARARHGDDIYAIDTSTGKALARLTGLSGNSMPSQIISVGKNGRIIVVSYGRGLNEIAFFDLSDLLTPD